MMDWTHEAALQLLEHAKLGYNWDSYNGCPPTMIALGRALKLLSAFYNPYWPVPKPAWLGPTRNGGIGMEWTEPELELELEGKYDGVYILFNTEIERRCISLVGLLKELANWFLCEEPG